MNIEKQVVSLELAKKLKELGCPQDDSLWHWADVDALGFSLYPHDVGSEKIYDYFLHLYGEEDANTLCAAPTVAELGEMLPYSIRAESVFDKKTKPYILEMNRDINDSSWWIKYIDDTRGSADYLKLTNAQTEADARAKMLIYLLENKLLKESKAFAVR